MKGTSGKCSSYSYYKLRLFFANAKVKTRPTVYKTRGQSKGVNKLNYKNDS